MFRIQLTLIVTFVALAGTPHVLLGQFNVASNGLSGLNETAGEYRKCWALLIGANYASRQDEVKKDPRDSKVLQQLDNAVSDAKAFADVLKQYYHGYDETTVTLLTDDSSDESTIPTADNIRKQIDRLCKVAEEGDSVLIFFAGHGFKDAETSCILPCDASIKSGRPLAGSVIKIPDDLVNMIGEIKCQHTLLIMDCCYSGEIFNSRQKLLFQEGQLNSSGDAALQREKGFQAIASCRSNQLASDGRLKNSPFTTALLDGLRHLPARSDADRRVWANRLAAYISMQPQFTESQRPECRNLIGTNGVFCFYPREQAEFEAFKLPPDLTGQLKAMFVSRQGNWWFDEMPWFIPSIRSEIIQEYTSSVSNPRANGQNTIEFEKDSLLEASKNVLDKGQLRTKATPETLAQFQARYRHAKMLLDAKDTQKLNDVLKLIEGELLGLCSGVRNSNAAASSSIDESESALIDAQLPIFAEDLHFFGFGSTLAQKRKCRSAIRGSDPSIHREERETKRTRCRHNLDTNRFVPSRLWAVLNAGGRKIL